MINEDGKKYVKCHEKFVLDRLNFLGVQRANQTGTKRHEWSQMGFFLWVLVLYIELKCKQNVNKNAARCK